MEKNAPAGRAVRANCVARAQGNPVQAYPVVRRGPDIDDPGSHSGDDKPGAMLEVRHVPKLKDRIRAFHIDGVALHLGERGVDASVAVRDKLMRPR